MPAEVQVTLPDRPVRGCGIGQPRSLQGHETAGFTHATGQFDIGCRREGHARHELGQAHVGAPIGAVHVQHVHGTVAPQHRGEFHALGSAQPTLVFFAEVGSE